MPDDMTGMAGATSLSELLGTLADVLDGNRSVLE